MERKKTLAFAAAAAATAAPQKKKKCVCKKKKKGFLSVTAGHKCKDPKLILIS